MVIMQPYKITYTIIIVLHTCIQTPYKHHPVEVESRDTPVS